jgi:DNA polymerase-3 subunit delta'
MPLRTDHFLGHHDIADRITRVLERGQAGQPYLFVGPEGCGKEATALEIARRVDCATPDTCTPERRCESCQKALTFQHPDIRWIGPAPASLEDDAKSDQVREILDRKRENPFYQPAFAASSQVLIGNPDHPGPLTVRGLIHFLRRRAFQGRWKIAVVTDAQRMNNAAANAFLKTLEEPPPATLIFLLSTSTASLLPTILSRCQKVVVEPFGEDRLAEILATLAPDAAPDARAEAARLADGNARKALALLGDEARALRVWAEDVFDGLRQGRAAKGQMAAELLQTGALPEGTMPEEAGKAQVTELAARRRRALLFYESLSLLLSETVACRERGDAWRPRATAAADLVRQAATTARTPELLAGIARVEQAKHEIDGNLNIGLVTAVLLQDLGDHVRA